MPVPSFLYFHPVHRTRDAHPCGWCGEQLPPGSRIVTATYSEGEAFVQAYLHDDCNQAWRRDPCNLEDRSCVHPHRRGQTCQETAEENTHA